MIDEVKEALKQFNREDLIDDGYEHNDLDTGITVSLTLKQMIKYNELQSNWNSLRGYTKAHIEIIENKLSLIGTCNPIMATKELQIYQQYLDKMNELESGEKN